MRFVVIRDDNDVNVHQWSLSQSTVIIISVIAIILSASALFFTTEFLTRYLYQAKLQEVRKKNQSLITVLTDLQASIDQMQLDMAELEEKDLRAIARQDQLEITRRDVDAEPRSVTVTWPDGKTQEVTLEEKSNGLFTGSLPITQSGLYRVSDGDRIFMAAAGSLNPIEFADVRATEDILAPLSKATGGAVRWIENGVPKLRRTGPDRNTAGRDWIGLTANGDYIVTGVEVVPLFPALLVLFLALGATALAWRREGD